VIAEKTVLLFSLLSCHAIMCQAYKLVMLLAVAGIQKCEEWSQLAGQKALTTISLWMVAKTVLTTFPCAAIRTQDHVSNRIAIQAKL